MGRTASPRANKPAYRPALKNAGWPSRRAAVGTTAEEEDEDVGKEYEELTPPWGWVALGWVGSRPHLDVPSLGRHSIQLNTTGLRNS